MSDRQPEACGRCSLSTVVDAADTADDGEDGTDRPPIEGGRIEVSDEQARRTLRAQVAAGAVKRKLNELGQRLTFGRTDGKV